MSDLNPPAFTKLHNPEHRQSVDEVCVMSCFVNTQQCFSKGLFIHSSTYVRSWTAYVCVWLWLKAWIYSQTDTDTDSCGHHGCGGSVYIIIWNALREHVVHMHACRSGPTGSACCVVLWNGSRMHKCAGSTFTDIFMWYRPEYAASIILAFGWILQHILSSYEKLLTCYEAVQI